MKRISIIAILLLVAILLPGCTSLSPTEQDLTVVGKVGDYEVYYDELRYFVMNYKTQVLDSKYGDISGDPEKIAEYEAELMEYVGAAITRNYAVMLLCDGFSVDYEAETILEQVDLYVDETIEEAGGKKEYKKQLDSLFLTDRFYRIYLQMNYAERELKYVFADDFGFIPGTDDEIKEYMNSDDFICTRHICVLKDDSAPAAVKAKIEMIYDELEGGALFEDLIGMYSEDYQDTGNGYYFTYGEMDKNYEEAAFELDEYEYSEIIETSYGYYIIMKCEKDEEYMDDHFADLKNQIQYALTYNKVSEQQEKLSFALNDYGLSLDLYGMK